jgi:hypothetical protein
VYFICCKILNIEPGSDVETIKCAFRKLAKELHPDVNSSEKAHHYFIIAQNAYQYLIDHPYSKVEADLLLNQKSRLNFRPKQSFDQAIKYKHNPLSNKTLREVLKYSLTARIFYIIFHLLFISIGILLIYRPVYDFFFYEVDFSKTSYWSYLILFVGLLLGVFLTTIFLYTGIKFIRDR